MSSGEIRHKSGTTKYNLSCTKNAAHRQQAAVAFNHISFPAKKKGNILRYTSTISKSAYKMLRVPNANTQKGQQYIYLRTIPRPRTHPPPQSEERKKRRPTFPQPRAASLLSSWSDQQPRPPRLARASPLPRNPGNQGTHGSHPRLSRPPSPARRRSPLLRPATVSSLPLPLPSSPPVMLSSHGLLSCRSWKGRHQESKRLQREKKGVGGCAVDIGRYAVIY